MQDRSTGCSRGFGFVTYCQESSAEKVLVNYDAHYIKQKWVEVKIATPKESISTEDSSSGFESEAEE